MKKLILLLIVIAVIATGWLLYFNDEDTALKVNLSEARYMDLGNSLEFSGKVVPEKMYSVMSETGGTIKEIYVSEGGKVNIGDPLFDLDTTQIENMLKEAKLNYDILKESEAQTVMSQGTGRSLMEEKIKIALALSQTTGYDFESFNNAFSDSLNENTAAMVSSLKDMSLKDITGSDSYEQIESDNLALAELAVQKLQDQLDSMSYKSLMKGTVVSVNINEGEVLSPGIPAMIIADTDNTLIEGYVYEKDLYSISENMRVKIIAEDTSYTGKVASLGKAATELGEQSNYGAMTKIEITPAGNINKIPGATVDLEIALKSKENVLAIPIECLAGGYVYVVGKDDILEKRAVETGFKDTFYVEILSGLGEGEKVVLTPKNFKEGERVTYDRG